MVAIDGLELQVVIFRLLESRFQVNSSNRIIIPELPHILQQTLMTNLPYVDLDASQIQYYFAEEPLLNDGHYLRINRCVYYDLL